MLDQALNLLQQFLQNPVEEDAKWMQSARKFVNNAETVHTQLNNLQCDLSYWEHIQTINNAINEDMFSRGNRYPLLGRVARPLNDAIVELAKEAGISDAQSRVFKTAMDTQAIEADALTKQIQRNAKWQSTWKLR